MTAKTAEEALAIERTRGDEYLAQVRAEAWRAGAMAMREAIARWAIERSAGHYSPDAAAEADFIANRILFLPVPEVTHDR